MSVITSGRSSTLLQVSWPLPFSSFKVSCIFFETVFPLTFNKNFGWTLALLGFRVQRSLLSYFYYLTLRRVPYHLFSQTSLMQCLGVVYFIQHVIVVVVQCPRALLSLLNVPFFSNHFIQCNSIDRHFNYYSFHQGNFSILGHVTYLLRCNKIWRGIVLLKVYLLI